jgi:uncharacterized membrane protein YdjX (TVP38/TMEM64 family)
VPSQPPLPEHDNPPPLALRRALPLVLLILGAIMASVALGDAVGFELLRENRAELIAWRNANYGLTALAYMAGYAVLIAFSVPGSFVLTVLGGFLFGLVWGTLLAVIAGTAGATAIFLAARTGFGEAMRARWLENKPAGTFARVERGLRANEVSYLLLLRLVPAVPFPIANVAPAFFGVSTRRFAATTFVGITPGTALTAWIGVGVGEVLARGGTPNLALLREPYVLGPLVGTIVLVSLPIVVGWVRARRRGADSRAGRL